MNDKIEKKTVPSHVVDFFKSKHDKYPCFTQTRNVISDAITLLTKKNKIIWFDKFFDGEINFIRQALIDYSTTYKIMIYCCAIEQEKTYMLFIMSTEENTTQVEFLTKGLNKYYTIDII
jgi:hypothetical protein